MAGPRKPSRRQQGNARLLRKIRHLYQESDGVFGRPRTWEELRYEGENCSLNRAARLMHAKADLGIPSKKQWSKRKSTQRPNYLINHLDREFTANQSDSKWVTDITYIRIGEGCLYVAAVIDLHHRQVVGWSMSHKMDKQLDIRGFLRGLW